MDDSGNSKSKVSWYHRFGRRSLGWKEDAHPSMSPDNNFQEVVDRRTRLGLRKNIYTQATNYARTQSAEYELILLSPAATDMMNYETEPPHSYDEPPDKQMCTPDRARWNGAFAFMSSAFCVSFNMSTPAVVLIYSFRYSSLSIGIAATFLMTLFLIVIPVMNMEQAFGQIFQGGIVKAYAALSKRARAVGFLAVLFLWLKSPLHAVTMSKSLVYLKDSFRRVPPWVMSKENVEACAVQYNEEGCTQTNFCKWMQYEESPNNCTASHLNKALAHYRQTSYGTKDLSTVKSVKINHVLLIAMVVGLVAVGIISFFGITVMSHMANLSSIACIIFFTLFAVIAVSMKGSSLAFWDSRYPPNSSYGFILFPLVINAIILSWGLVLGSQYTIATHSPVNTNIVHAAATVTIVRAGAVLLFAICNVCLEGYSQIAPGFVDGQLLMAEGDANPFSFIAGQELVFLVFPVYIGLLSASPIYAIVFYLIYAVFEMLSLVTHILTFLMALENTSTFARCHYLFRLGGSFAVIFAISFPFVFVFPSTYTPTDRVLVALEDALGGIVCVMLFFQIFSAIWGVGWEDYMGVHEDPVRHPALKLWQFSTSTKKIRVYLFIAVSLSFVGIGTIGRVFFTTAGAKFAIFICISGFGILSALPINAIFPYPGDTLKSVLLGDVEILRKKLNEILAGARRRFWRLPLPWSASLKFLVPLTLIWVLAARLEALAYIEEAKEKSLRIGLITTFFSLFALCTIVAVAYPPAWSWVRPEECNEYTLKNENLPKKNLGPQPTKRRAKFRQWEEFLSPQTLWEKSMYTEDLQLSSNVKKRKKSSACV